MCGWANGWGWAELGEVGQVDEWVGEWVVGWWVRVYVDGWHEGRFMCTASLESRAPSCCLFQLETRVNSFVLTYSTPLCAPCHVAGIVEAPPPVGPEQKDPSLWREQTQG